MMTYASRHDIKKLEPYIVNSFHELGFSDKEISEGCWTLERSGKKIASIALHKFLERVAAKAGIDFYLPSVLNCSEKEIAVCVQGKDRHGAEAWSIGEASVANCPNPYRWAMAEKRAKDRVILKLLGIAGYMYSEEEADEFKEVNQEEKEAADEFKKEAIAEKTAKTRETNKIVEKMKEGKTEEAAIAEVKAEAEKKNKKPVEQEPELPLDVRFSNAMNFCKVNAGKKNIANSIIDRFNKLERDLLDAGFTEDANIIKTKLNEFVDFEDEIKY